MSIAREREYRARGWHKVEVGATALDEMCILLTDPRCAARRLLACSSWQQKEGLSPSVATTADELQLLARDDVQGQWVAAANERLQTKMHLIPQATSPSRYVMAMPLYMDAKDGHVQLAGVGLPKRS